MMAVKQRCIRCQQDEGITALTERAKEEGDGGMKCWGSAGGKGESAPVSRCQIPAGTLACQLSWLRRPAGMVMGLCVLAILPLPDYCNAIIDVQMGL